MKIDTPATTGTTGGDPDVAAFMAARGWLGPGERVERAARAGEGNMNRVLRVTTTARSLILKQARPWVENMTTIVNRSATSVIGLMAGTNRPSYHARPRALTSTSRVIAPAIAGTPR